MGSNDMADRVGDATLHRESDTSERMAQQMSSFALDCLSANLFVLEEFADVDQDRTGDHRVHVDGERSTEELLHRFGSTTGDVHDAPPVSYTHLRAHETVLDLVCRL